MIPYYMAALLVTIFFMGIVLFNQKKLDKERKAAYQKWIISSLLIALLLPLMINLFDPATAFVMTALLALIVGSQLPVPAIQEPVGSEGLIGEEMDESDSKGIDKSKTELDVSVELNSVDEEKIESLNLQDQGNQPALGETVCTGEDAATGEALREALLEAESAMVETVETTDPLEPEEVQDEIYRQLPEELSETLAEILLMDGMIGMEAQDLESAEKSLWEVCTKAESPEQRMMAFSQLKNLYGSQGHCEKILETARLLEKSEQMKDYTELLRDQANYMERLIEIINLHDQQGIIFEDIPDAWIKMAWTFDQKIQNRSEEE